MCERVCVCGARACVSVRVRAHTCARVRMRACVAAGSVSSAADLSALTARLGRLFYHSAAFHSGRYTLRLSSEMDRELLHRSVRPLPHLHRDWAHRCHVCTRTGLALPTSTLKLGSPLPHLHRDWT